MNITKGNWKVHKSNRGYFVSCQSVRNGSLCESDAHLIAAAPRMYEALKGMMEIAETAMPDTYFQSDSRVNATREALAKAEEK